MESGTDVHRTSCICHERSNWKEDLRRDDHGHPFLKAGALCAESLAKIRSYLSCATFKGADETGLRADGRLMWLHTVCNDNATYLYADRKRGFNAIESDGLLLDARGILIHDCWGSYFKLPNMAHAICLQHIQRELRAAAIREKCHEEYFK